MHHKIVYELFLEWFIHRKWNKIQWSMRWNICEHDTWYEFYKAMAMRDYMECQRERPRIERHASKHSARYILRMQRTALCARRLYSSWRDRSRTSNSSLIREISPFKYEISSDPFLIQFQQMPQYVSTSMGAAILLMPRCRKLHNNC